MRLRTRLCGMLIALVIGHSSFVWGEEKQVEKRPSKDSQSYDVLVYGATPGGFCAAIAAAREGASVLLLEPTKHVGGVNTGGLSFSDSNQTVRSTVLGLFEEWHQRIEHDYQQRGVKLPYEVTVKDQSKWTYEPHVAARVTAAMLEEAKVTVVTNQPLTHVKKERKQIRELLTAVGSYRAKIFVDATYEGDLLAAAGVGWMLGREGREEYGESLAGKQYPKGRMNFCGLDEQGQLLPLITTADAGPEAEGDGHVMVYSFRLCLTNNPENRVPFPAPAEYDPARFEAVRRYFAQEKRPVLLWDLYPLPGGKFDANNGIGKQFSMGLVGGGDDWSEANPEERAKIWEAHRQYTLELYHFLTTDSAVPEELRQQLSELGLCRDEFPETDHWSPQLYVREGRRMQGVYVLSQRDILENPEKPDPIAISSFPIDSHDCQRVATAEGVINEGTIFPVRMPQRRHGYPYQVPYRSLTPKAEECQNLLVPVALSSTHVALSSVRVEPTWMILGQSAGVAAALAAKLDVTVQELPYPQLKERLKAQGQVLELPTLPEIPAAAAHPRAVNPADLPGIVLDDEQAKWTGDWAHSQNFPRHIGRGYLHDNAAGNGQASVVFTTKVPQSGRYELRMAYSAHETRAQKVPVSLTNGSQTMKLTVDQTQPLPENSPARKIGELDLTSEHPVTITVTNAETDGFVIVDGFQLLPLDQ